MDKYSGYDLFKKHILNIPSGLGLNTKLKKSPNLSHFCSVKRQDRQDFVPILRGTQKLPVVVPCKDWRNRNLRNWVQACVHDQGEGKYPDDGDTKKEWGISWTGGILYIYIYKGF